MISVNGFDLWTVHAYTRLMRWLADHGFNEPMAVASLWDGDPQSSRGQADVLEDMRRILARLPADTPDWVRSLLTFGVYVLTHEAYPPTPPPPPREVVLKELGLTEAELSAIEADVDAERRNPAP